MDKLDPWKRGPFELIRHAEMHLQDGDDFDKRISLISFDNAIEVSITTYLNLNPIQRGNKQYRREDVENWLDNYHTKIDFFFDELNSRNITPIVDKSHIIWYHDLRNEQYHMGGKNTPGEMDLKGIREVAMWVFSVLFDVPNIDELLDESITQKKSQIPERDDLRDRLIDGEYGMMELAGQKYYASLLLHGIDPIAYKQVSDELMASETEDVEEDTEEEGE